MMRVLIATVIVLAGAVELLGQEAAQSNSLFQRSREQTRLRQIQGAAGGSVHGRSGAGAGRDKGTSVREASWLTVSQPTPKGFRVHDLVTIVVNETSSSETKAESTTERSSSFSAILDEWLKIQNVSIRPAAMSDGDPQVKFGMEREFEGEGEMKRKDTMTAYIQAEVIDVMPNGNLVLEATHKVTSEDEVTIITLTGVCRSKDVSFDNSIRSSLLAHLDLRKEHHGVARDATKRGWLTGLFDAVNPI